MGNVRYSNISVRITPELKDKFISICDNNNISYSDAIRNFIRFFISREGRWRKEDV